MRRILPPGRGARGRSRSRRRAPAPRRARRPRPPTTSRSTRCGPERTSAGDEIVGAAELEPVGRARPRGRPACPARASRCRRAGGRRRRRASRGAAPRAPSSPRRRRGRARRAAPASPRRRGRRARSRPSRRRRARRATPASTRSRTGATPAPSRRFEVGQCATPVPVSPNRAISSAREVDAVGAPDVVGEPAELVEVLDGRAAVELAAVRLLLDGLGEVGVQRETRAGARARPTPPSGAA